MSFVSRYWHRSALCVHAAQTARDLSAAGVDRDEEKPSAWPFPRGRTIKMFFALSDVAEDGGPLAVVPGSHLLEYGPWETLRRSYRSSMTLECATPPPCPPSSSRLRAVC